mmetsp:Transcript_29644/g.78544  ORF Transcript_29644/g.78544 Transcript_29644/m.78544 type:complete len:238 (+) Transcript_29644:1720-2433(+)
MWHSALHDSGRLRCWAYVPLRYAALAGGAQHHGERADRVHSARHRHECCAFGVHGVAPGAADVESSASGDRSSEDGGLGREERAQDSGVAPRAQAPAAAADPPLWPTWYGACSARADGPRAGAALRGERPLGTQRHRQGVLTGVIQDSDRGKGQGPGRQPRDGCVSDRVPAPCQSIPRRQRPRALEGGSQRSPRGSAVRCGCGRRGDECRNRTVEAAPAERCAEGVLHDSGVRARAP